MRGGSSSPGTPPRPPAAARPGMRLVAIAFAAVLALAIQTDVIGDPWVAYCVWALAGALVAVRRTAFPEGSRTRVPVAVSSGS